MRASPIARSRAPIEYDVMRRPYNAVRAIAGGLLALVNLYGALILEVAESWPGLAASLIVLTDAVLRLTRGTSAMPPLLVDITAVSLVIALIGGSPAAQATGFVYVLVAALLLLPLHVAAVAIGYALVWVGTVFAASHLGGVDGILRPEASPSAAGAMDLVVAVVFVGVIAVLLVGAVRALLDAQDRSRKALDQERRAVQIKNEFVSMVSHELRTPLTGISGFTETLRDSWQSLAPDEVDEFLSIMREETQHLADLVEDILVIPRLEAGYLRLNAVDLDVVAALVDAAGLILEGRLEYEISLNGPVMVSADPVRLKQILRNLLGNAMKYGGDQVLIEGKHHGPSQYLIVISDNGPGVPEEHRERIFEHFEQLSKGDARLEQGVGLGLPIARKLAKAMSGELWYEARFPVGSHFCFTLPLAESEREGGERQPAESHTSELAQASG